MSGLSPGLRNPTVDPHHQRNVGAIHVGVQQAGLKAQGSQGHGQVDGHRGLADAAFSGTDGDQVLHAGNRRLGHFARLIGSHWFYGNSRGGGRVESREAILKKTNSLFLVAGALGGGIGAVGGLAGLGTLRLAFHSWSFVDGSMAECLFP